MFESDEIAGRLVADPGDGFAVVASRFNEFIVRSLVLGAFEGFDSLGVERERVRVIWVPGALEIANAARLARDHLGVAGIVALGAVVRGETSHYDVVVSESAGQLASLAANSRIPIVNGILTVETMEQGIDRAGGKSGNKGYDAALNLVQLVDLYRRIVEG